MNRLLQVRPRLLVSCPRCLNRWVAGAGGPARCARCGLGMELVTDPEAGSWLEREAAVLARPPDRPAKPQRPWGERFSRNDPIPEPPSSWPEQKRDIVAAVRAGCTQREVAERFGVSPNTVGEIVRRCRLESVNSTP